MASLARTEFVMILDDDLMPGDSNVLRDLVAFSRRESAGGGGGVVLPHSIMGPFGMAFNAKDATKTYAQGFHMNATKYPW